jgi:hypothetical protein
MMQAKPLPDVILTIDAGGTSVRFRLEQHGTLLCEDIAVAASENGHPPDFPFVVTHPDLVIAGITKITRPGVVDAWNHALERHFPDARVHIVPDFELAAAAALDTECSVMLLAGTGSLACVFRDATLIRIGGRGWEYGDEGSGAFITTEAIRRCIRALDGMLPHTSFLDSLIDLAGTTDAGAFATWARCEAEMHGRGFLVPKIGEAAVTNDTDAINLLSGAAGWLARLARTAHFKASTRTDLIVIKAVGGLWNTGPYMKRATITALSKWFDMVEFSYFEGSNLEGGIRLASLTIQSGCDTKDSSTGTV